MGLTGKFRLIGLLLILLLAFLLDLSAGPVHIPLKDIFHILFSPAAGNDTLGGKACAMPRCGSNKGLAAAGKLTFRKSRRFIVSSVLPEKSKSLDLRRSPYHAARDIKWNRGPRASVYPGTNARASVLKGEA